ncbi:protein DA1 [Candidatus Viridilinea mediisalina]|uniref:Zinc-binding protein n=1 Tax=Candidatus Viridilinea mediisalina TaxID=2024553 RepID=A0A2A6RJL9_9CHLR|nr:protein DA1 [Candidatus Viridilinea mediisalina]PDW03131.1 zinc-binding protein [Candidatus Viridilinea mediisalina]
MGTNATCAACGGPLYESYYTLIDRPERYCQQCIERRPRCASCGAPLGEQHWRLHDGRQQCGTCHATAIYDPGVARTIFDETVSALVAQLGLRLNVGVAFRLVDAPTLEELRASGGKRPPRGFSTLGLYQRRGHIRAIYMLYGLPRLSFRTTVAHEYAHAWQGERCPLLNDPELREGHAEWVAYHHLRWLGCHKAAERMLASHHPYRPALERLLALEQQLGLEGVHAYMIRAE